MESGILTKWTGVAVSAAVFGVGCSGAMDGEGQGPEANAESYSIVAPGKADNYYSNVAKEFELSGSIDVKMSEEQYTDEAERNKVVSQRLTAVGLYLTTYLTDKFRGIDSDDSGEIEDDEVFFENTDYGGFKAMVRNYSVETVDIEKADQEAYSVDFSIDVAGPPQFPTMVLEEGGERVDGGVKFAIDMPKGAISDPEDVSRGEIRDFDPADYDGELETVDLKVNPLPKISDAYPHYADFMKDGVYDITLFYGHDYNKARHDLQGAREAFETLEQKGFEAPTDSFEELKHDSGPFVRTIRRAGDAAGPAEVRVEVRVFHSNMFEDERSYQHDLAIEELTGRDVFFYNGHAGPYYGLYLDGDHKASVDYRKLSEVEFPEERQQLFVAQGCQTYSQYADMLYANPNKSEANLDAITTVNYSYGLGTMRLFKNLIDFDGEGVHEPVSFYEIIEDLNSEFYNRYKDVFYGVMGIDGNPQVHPYANLEAVGQSCSAAADCGGNAEANVCVDGRCAARVLAEDGCPEDMNFGYLGQGNSVDGGVCYK